MKNKILAQGLWVAVVLSATSGAFAQTAQMAAETRADRSFGAIATVQLSSSLHQLEDAEHDASSVLVFLPYVVFPGRLKLTAQGGVKKSLENEREITATNTRLTLSRPGILLNSYLTLMPAIAGTLATDPVSVKRDSLIAAFHLQPRVDVDLGRLGLGGLSLTYQLTATRNIHRYATQRTGVSNAQHSLSNLLGASYALTNQLDLSVNFIRAMGFTYGGSVRNNFDLSEVVSYGFSEKFSLSIGHSNSGEAFKDNGKDSNIAFFHPNDSSVFGQVSIIF